MFARILAIISFILTTSYLLLVPAPAFAQTPYQNGTGQATTQSSVVSRQSSENQLTPSPLPLPPYVTPTSPLYTDLIVNNLFHTFSCLAIGQSVIGAPCLTYLQGVPVLSKVNTSGGVLGATTNLIGMLYTSPPVRTADYLASVGQDLGFAKTANAQVVGSGAQVLNPIISLWQVSRNISYVFLIIIFLVIGLMVMFRNRLNPQTVITAQTALPGLVIGLIMITFSFFFAGLISDMAFIGTNVVGYYFTAAQGSSALADPTRLNLADSLKSSNILTIMGSLTGIIDSGQVATFAGAVFDSLGGEGQKAVRTLAFFLSNQFLTPLLGGVSANPWAAVVTPLITGVISTITAYTGISLLLGQLLSLAASLALIYQMLKLLFKLITTWLTIIFLTISAPFQFLFASLPGRQGMMTGWILNMLGHILVFPAVIAVIYFVAFILGPSNLPKNFPLRISQVNQIQNNNFTPTVYAQAGNEIIGEAKFPLFGGIGLDFVKILLAFGALMALPVIPDIIIRSVGKAGQAGQMIGQEIMGGSRFGQGYAQKGYMGGVQSGQSVSKGLLGEPMGAVWNPTKVNPNGTVGGFDFPRRPGLLIR